MFTKILSASILVICSQLAFGQPANNGNKKQVVDSFSANIKLIVKNSQSGFINYRYNELQTNSSISYSTTLSTLGFDKRFVQTGTVTPYDYTSSEKLPYYIATSSFADMASAIKFYNTIKNKIRNSLKPVKQDSTIKSGFSRYTSFMVAKPVKDSFVTIELLILPEQQSGIVALRIFHNKASTGKGNMKSPPVSVITNKNHFNQVSSLIQALMDYSPNNFVAIRGTLLQNEEWSPTYTSVVTFRNFRFPKIAYVTNNLWNQYTTDIFIKDKDTANQFFLQLAAEIDQCKSAFPEQVFETRSAADDKWWYYENKRKDVEGRTYKNTIRLTLKKFQYGEGYYVVFEFRKSVG